MEKMRATHNCLLMFFLFLVAAAGTFPMGPAIGKDEPSDDTSAEQLVFKGREQPRVVACVACHRVSGEGDASTAFGNLTGLTTDYFSKQLKDYKSGVRENRVMQVIAKSLSDRDIVALAEFYAKTKPSKAQQDIPEAPAIGVKLVEEGDDERGLIACLACHGREERKSNDDVPNLHGQHALYIVNQLSAWQDGKRKNDPGSVMSNMAKKMTTEEIAAVAIYFARRSRSGTD